MAATASGGWACALNATFLDVLEQALGVVNGRERLRDAATWAKEDVTVVETSWDVARRYGQLFADLRRAGTPSPVNDIWIAATTMGVGVQLVTFDHDFHAILGLSHALL